MNPLERLEFKDGEEVTVRMEKIGDREKVIEQSADKELLEEFMLEAESR